MRMFLNALLLGIFVAMVWVTTWAGQQYSLIDAAMWRDCNATRTAIAAMQLERRTA